MSESPFKRSPNALENLIREVVRDELAKPETIAAIWPALQQRIDAELTAQLAQMPLVDQKEMAEALAQLPPIGGGQSSVAGGRP